jgi:hypothetical protein
VETPCASLRRSNSAEGLALPRVLTPAGCLGTEAQLHRVSPVPQGRQGWESGHAPIRLETLRCLPLRRWEKVGPGSRVVGSVNTPLRNLSVSSLLPATYILSSTEHRPPRPSLKSEPFCPAGFPHLVIARGGSFVGCVISKTYKRADDARCGKCLRPTSGQRLRRRERRESESHFLPPSPGFPFRHRSHPARVMAVTNPVSHTSLATYAISARALSPRVMRPHPASPAFPGDRLVRKGGVASG